MNLFETTGSVDENVLKEIKWGILPPRNKVIFLICMIFECIAIAFLLYTKSYFWVSLLIILLLILAIENVLMAKKIVKINLNRINEITGKNEIKYTTSFNESGLNIQNHGTGATSNIQYDHFVRCTETEHVITLYTKANQYVTIFKNCMDDVQKKELHTCIKERCKNIKKIRI